MAFVTTGFITFVTLFWSILPFVAVLDLIGVITILFVDRLDPRSFVFWLMVIIVLPFVGLLLYFMFGNHFYSDRRFRRKLEKDRPYLEPPVSMGGSNSISFLWTREEFRDNIMQDLQHVSKSVWIEAPVIRNSTVWDTIMVRVAELAAEGLDVRVMTASYGFGRAYGVNKVRRAGGRFCTFNNRLYASFSKRYRNRNLRMQMILDGNLVYTGIECMVRVQGPVVSHYIRRFVLDWAHGSGDPREHVPVSKLGDRVYMLADGRDTDDPGCSAKDLLDVALSARKTLYMCMPYLTPDEDMYNALKLSAYAGTDVRILLPARTWYTPQKWNSLSAAYPLMKAGVHVYFINDYSNRRLLVSDGRFCMVGSATMSTMTLAKDLNLSTVTDSKEVCSKAEDMFLKELDDAVECTVGEYENRTFFDKVRIMASRFCMYMN